MANDALIGKIVSHYKILDILGKDGMGIVCKVEDIKLGKIVAHKFLPIQFALLALSLSIIKIFSGEILKCEQLLSIPLYFENAVDSGHFGSTHISSPSNPNTSAGFMSIIERRKASVLFRFLVVNYIKIIN